MIRTTLASVLLLGAVDAGWRIGTCPKMMGVDSLPEYEPSPKEIKSFDGKYIKNIKTEAMVGHWFMTQRDINAPYTKGSDCMTAEIMQNNVDDARFTVRARYTKSRGGYSQVYGNYKDCNKSDTKETCISTMDGLPFSVGMTLVGAGENWYATYDCRDYRGVFRND